MELGCELNHEEGMLGMGSAPDRAGSASLGEEGEPRNSRKQGHQPVLWGSGEEGQRYGQQSPGWGWGLGKEH